MQKMHRRLEKYIVNKKQSEEFVALIISLMQQTLFYYSENIDFRYLLNIRKSTYLSVVPCGRHFLKLEAFIKCNMILISNVFIYVDLLMFFTDVWRPVGAKKPLLP